jgi:pimeloyl-ACP methyl ester carboxylesterase
MTLGKKPLCGAGVALLAAGLGFLARPVDCFNEVSYLRESLAGMESRTVAVAGHRVHYEAAGPADGPAVVLVHGLGGRAEDWLELAPYLVRAGYRVYMPDLPGYGRSEQPADFSYSVRDEADVVAGFMDALGLKRADLGGLSMGGGIAQHVAFKHPELVRRLILFDSVGIFETPKWDVRLFTPQSAEELDRLDALLLPVPPKIPGFVVRDILRISKRNEWVVHRALATMLTGQDATDKLLPRLQMPVLIVWGAEDRIVPLSQGETMHRLVPQSQMEVFPGCGHLAVRQCAAELGPKVVEFVKRSSF